MVGAHPVQYLPAFIQARSLFLQRRLDGTAFFGNKVELRLALRQLFTRISFDLLDAGEIGFRLLLLTFGAGGFTIEGSKLRFNLRNAARGEAAEVAGAKRPARVRTR